MRVAKKTVSEKSEIQIDFQMSGGYQPRGFEQCLRSAAAAAAREGRSSRRRQWPAPARQPRAFGGPPAMAPGLKDPVAERPNHSNLCTSEFRYNSVRIEENSQNSSETLKIQRVLNISYNVRRNPEKISSISDQNSMKFVEK